jgi:hypothetical protein
MEERRGPGRPPKEEKPTESLGRVYPKDYRIFYGPEDKGAAKPAFCYPQRIETLKEEVRSMQRALDMGYVASDRRTGFEARLKRCKNRVDAINENTERVQKIIDNDKDYWVKRRKDLAKEIRNALPSRKDVKERRVNPFRVAKMEKEGLGAMKKEYIIVSRALGEESNTSFLQRD